MLKIVLTGGGTAGHVIPCLTLVPELKKYFSKIYYIGSETGIENTLVAKTDIPFYKIPCVKLRRKLTPKNLLIPFKLKQSISKCKSILKELKPDVVFNKGGYVGLPVVIASKSLKIPVVSHESDLTAGLANKIASRYSAMTLTAFKPPATAFKNGKHVGIPLKKADKIYDKNAVKSEWGFSVKPTVLAFGGSLGSVALNKAIFSILDDLLKDYNVLHIVGKNNAVDLPVKNGYKALPYLDDMLKAYAIADVVISRCGANSAFEILSKNLPCVFIPLPKSESRGDQIENAEYFFKQGYALMLTEDLLTPSSLKLAIDCAYKTKRHKAPVITDASSEIAKILHSVATKKPT